MSDTDHGYRVLPELPRCCMTCWWMADWSGDLSRCICEHGDRDTPEVEPAGVCELWEGGNEY